MSTDGQRTLWRRNIAENFNRLSRAHERHRRQTTDGPTMTYSEHELEFTFAKKHTVAWRRQRPSIIRFLGRYCSYVPCSRPNGTWGNYPSPELMACPRPLYTNTVLCRPTLSVRGSCCCHFVPDSRVVYGVPNTRLCRTLSPRLWSAAPSLVNSRLYQRLVLG